MSESSGPPIRRAGERYTEQELAEILRRAAEHQEGTPDADRRFSLAEIQQIASEVGIAPAHVAAAAAELSRRPPPPVTGGVLGAPTVFRFERWIDGEIPTSAIGELFDIARGDAGAQGQVGEALDTVEWRGKGEVGSTVVSVTRRDGRTRVGVFTTRTDAAALAATGAVVGGVAGAMLIGGPLSLAAEPGGVLAVVAAVAVSLGWAGGASWLLVRSVWRRIARPWAARTEALGAELTEAAQRAIDAARKDSE